jgi:putative RNA 2'-phosphotransferase
VNENLTRLSKTISHALRHKPQDYGLTLDSEGWVPIAALLAALQNRRNAWKHVSEADLHAILAQSDKQRFEMRDGKIRAFYGHSVPEKIAQIPAIPPPVLYHGTTAQAALIIRSEGLKPMNRQYVHLSADEKTARLVGLRRTGKPALLRIAARKAHEQGIAFYLGNDTIWLANSIPPEFIQPS